MYSISELYDLTHTKAASYLGGFTYPWEALKGIKEMIEALGKTLDEVKALVAEGGKGNDAVISAGCTITVSEFANAVFADCRNISDFRFIFFFI